MGSGTTSRSPWLCSVGRSRPTLLAPVMAGGHRVELVKRPISGSSRGHLFGERAARSSGHDPLTSYESVWNALAVDGRRGRGPRRSLPESSTLPAVGLGLRFDTHGPDVQGSPRPSPPQRRRPRRRRRRRRPTVAAVAANATHPLRSPTHRRHPLPCPWLQLVFDRQHGDAASGRRDEQLDRPVGCKNDRRRGAPQWARPPAAHTHAPLQSVGLAPPIADVDLPRAAGDRWSERFEQQRMRRRVRSSTAGRRSDRRQRRELGPGRHQPAHHPARLQQQALTIFNVGANLVRSSCAPRHKCFLTQ